MQKIILLALACFFFFSCSKDVPENKPKELLQNISEEDKEKLSNFFALLLKEHSCFAYTLFGDKPISVADFSLRPYIYSTYQPSSYEVFREGIQIWERYASQFTSKQFVIKPEIENLKHASIYLINKPAVIKTVNTHLAVFQHHLGKEVDAETLVEQLCCQSCNLLKSLGGSTELYGILLGFGPENANDFVRRTDLCHLVSAKMNPPLLATAETLLNPLAKHLTAYFHNKSEPFPIESELILIAELNAIMERQAGYEMPKSDHFLDRFSTPAFMIFKTDLQQSQQVDFTAARDNIRQHYKQGNFLEVTLNRFMSVQ